MIKASLLTNVKRQQANQAHTDAAMRRGHTAPSVAAWSRAAGSARGPAPRDAAQGEAPRGPAIPLRGVQPGEDTPPPAASHSNVHEEPHAGTAQASNQSGRHKPSQAAVTTRQ